MKHFILAFTLTIIFLGSLVITKNIYSESIPYTKAYADYVYNLDLYKKSHDDYELARGNYLQSKTLASQEKAQAATAKMLQDRDQVVINYLTTIRAKLSETNGLDENQKNDYYSQLDTQVGWYTTHKTTLKSNSSLESLVSASNDAKQHYQDTKIVIYKSLSIVENGKLNSYQTSLVSILEQLEPKLAEIKADGEKDTTNMERSVEDIKSKIDASNQKEAKAWEGLDKMTTKDYSLEKPFTTAEKLFLEGLQLLKDANGLLGQIIENIKVK